MHRASSDSSRARVASAILAGVLSILALSQATLPTSLADTTIQGAKP